MPIGKRSTDTPFHKQGSLMPRYYLKNLGGATKVNKFAAFGAIAYGTTLLGIAPFLTGLGLYDPIKNIVDPVCKSCFQFLVGSPFLTELNKGGDTVPGYGKLCVSMILNLSLDLNC